MDDSKTVSNWRLRTERRGCHPWTVRIMVGLRGRAQATPLAALPRRSLLQRSQACSIRSSGRAPTASSPRTLPSPHLISSRMRLPLPRRSSRYCSKKLLPPLPPQIPSWDQKTKKKRELRAVDRCDEPSSVREKMEEFSRCEFGIVICELTSK